MSVINNAVAWAMAIANDNTHGYDQTHRWGPDYDCSALVISAFQQAGVPVKTNGATYTGNMKNVFLRTGFKDVTKSVKLKTGAGLQFGDVCLKEGSHVVIYIGNRQIVHASINELGKISGGKTGDQTGREICVRSYYNKPWNVILRYTGENVSTSAPANDGILRVGVSGSEVKTMQQKLIAVGYSCGKYGADGKFGSDTKAALKHFQSDYSLEFDGEYGPISKAKLAEVYAAKSTASGSGIIYAVGKVYTLQAEMKVRTGAGTNYRAKKHSELTTDGKKHDTDRDGALDKGTRVTCKGYRNIGKDIWVLTPSGWIAGYYNGKRYIA